MGHGVNLRRRSRWGDEVLIAFSIGRSNSRRPAALSLGSRISPNNRSIRNHGQRRVGGLMYSG